MKHIFQNQLLRFFSTTSMLVKAAKKLILKEAKIFSTESLLKLPPCLIFPLGYI
jgi:hypothetical protein